MSNVEAEHRQMGPDELQAHILSTYFSLRLGIVVASMLLPFVLYFGGRMRAGLDLQPSISDYYFAGDGVMRDWFVGTLCAVGVFLYLYKGFSAKENIALNIAGLFAVLTALIPCVCGDPGRAPSIHGASAVGFFLSMAFVCLRCAPETLELVENEPLKRRFRLAYNLVGGFLILSPIVAVAASYRLGLHEKKKFIVEAIGILVFAAYWLVKSRELSHTQAEREAAEKEATRVAGRGVVRRHGGTRTRDVSEGRQE